MVTTSRSTCRSKEAPVTSVMDHLFAAAAVLWFLWALDLLKNLWRLALPLRLPQEKE